MIRKICTTALGIIAASAMCSQLAVASTTTNPYWTPNSLNLRLGGYFPGSSGAKFFGGETQLTAGLDYNLSTSNGSLPGTTGAYFDYMGGAKNSGYVHSGGIGLDVRGMTGTSFYGAGIGLYNTAVRFADGTSGNHTGPGGKVFAGMNLGKRTSILLDYHIVPKSMGLNPSGLGVELGFHL